MRVARRADALAEVRLPVDVPSLPAPPGQGVAARRAAADRALTEMLDGGRGLLDAGTASGFDNLIDSWGLAWVGEDDREYAQYVGSLRHRLGRVEALMAAAELTHRRCERGWTLADRDYLSARARLGAPDPRALPSTGDLDEPTGMPPAARRHATSPFGRFEPPRSTA
jgi:hypothetical protein